MIRRPRKQINQMNVVPYIDVMLVLLIIFMITAPLINTGEIQLPSVGTQLPVSRAGPIEIVVKQDQSLQFRDGAGTVPATRVSRDELVSRVREIVARDPARPVVISADKNVRYEAVMSVLDLLKQNKVDKVGLLAQTGK